ncbi:MAG: hypothetical protein JWM33_297 [Caulobacteraceae bacterium]|nr:hypothetical protein [Caulobacteraceae bacterium]
MAIDTFLYFTGASDSIEIKGESQDDNYSKKHAIEVFSFSWGASNPVSIGSSSAGLGAGKVSLSSLNIMKKVDTASPLLFLACCKGTHFPKVNLELRKAGNSKNSEPYQVFELTSVFVESVQQSASSEEATESVSLAYGAIVFKYAPQDVNGKVGTLAPAGWDVIKNIAK